MDAISTGLGCCPACGTGQVSLRYEPRPGEQPALQCELDGARWRGIRTYTAEREREESDE